MIFIFETKQLIYNMYSYPFDYCPYHLQTSYRDESPRFTPFKRTTKSLKFNIFITYQLLQEGTLADLKEE